MVEGKRFVERMEEKEKRPLRPLNTPEGRDLSNFAFKFQICLNEKGGYLYGNKGMDKTDQRDC